MKKKKLDKLKPFRKKVDKPYTFKNRGYGGFKRLKGEFNIYFD
jgi:hypothetical protein